MSKRKILLVDDSKSARYALRLLLQKHECEVDPVESAEIALAKIRETPPDAIFMDHLMPGMNGFDALDAIKADSKLSHIPVVMCTANDGDNYQIQAREKGAIGILPKPGTPETLAKILIDVDSAIAKSRSAAAAAPAATATAASTGGSGGADIKPMLDAMRKEIEQSLTAKFNEQITKLRSDLHQRESEYAQALIQKIAKDILPDMMRKGAEQLEQRIVQRLSQGR